jgi:regulatory protein
MSQTPYNRALDLLSVRAYSVKELHRKLVQKDILPAEADAVVERLQAAGLLNDTSYSLAFARSKLLNSGASARRIRQDLMRKGVAPAIIADAIAQVMADEEVDTGAVVARLAKKKLALLGDLPPLVLKRRLYAFLARRGYDLDDIQAAIQDILPSA